MQASQHKNITRLSVVLLTIAVPLVAWITASDYKAGILVLAGIIGAMLAFVCFRSALAGFYITLSTAMLVRTAERMFGAELPVGGAMDLMILSSFLGLLVRKNRKSGSRVNYLRDPALLVVYVQMAYFVLQAFNPNIFNRDVWLLFIKLIARNIAFFFLAIQVFRSMTDVIRFFRFWLILSTYIAFHGCMQEWFGLLPFEWAYIMRNPDSLNTTLISGKLRIFSTMSDPAVLGLMMALGSVLGMILLSAGFKTISVGKKVALAFSVLLHLLALGYSGTRTGYVMIPAGLFLFLLVNLHNRNTIIAAMFFSICFGAILFGPFYGNATINRVRSAFIGTRDASLNVREVNRHNIQPYLYRHPIGGGVFTAGGEGKMYNPGHPLAGIPPDSGYLRLAMEQGWIALIITLVFYFLLLSYSVGNYFRSEGELKRLLCISISAMLFALMISMYAQESAGLMESAIFMNALAGITIKLKYL